MGTQKFTTPVIEQMNADIAEFETKIKEMREKASAAIKAKRDAEKELKAMRQSTIDNRYKPLIDYFGDVLLDDQEGDGTLDALIKKEGEIKIIFKYDAANDGVTIKASLKALPKEDPDADETI